MRCFNLHERHVHVLGHQYIANGHCTAAPICHAWTLCNSQHIEVCVVQVGAVVVGFDRRINYYKIQYACLCIRENPGCLFIATNLDAVTHLTDAQEWAGNGAMVGAIKGALLCCWCFITRVVHDIAAIYHTAKQGLCPARTWLHGARSSKTTQLQI